MTEPAPEELSPIVAAVEKLHGSMSTLPGYHLVSTEEVGAAKLLMDRSLSPKPASGPPAKVSIHEKRRDTNSFLTVEEMHASELECRYHYPLKSNFLDRLTHELGENSKKPLAPDQHESAFEFISNDEYAVVAMLETLDKARLIPKGRRLEARMVVPEHYERIIAGLSHKLERWPDDFPQTQAYLQALSGAMKESDIYQAFKGAHTAAKTTAPGTGAGPAAPPR